ncbi:MAG: hypothetical protein U1E20_06260 [Methylocystis sp.]|uniref:hypothetical protein n=1 Tax=Methylocystis sp. TaxID=1911079 RepID=UPI0039479EAF
MATRRAVELYALNVSSVGIDIVGLHDVLLRGPTIRDVLSFVPYQYFVKSDRSAVELARLLSPFIPAGFAVLALRPTESSGVFPDHALAWIEREPSPPRGEGHQPTPFEMGMIPSLDCLLPTEAEQQLHAMILAEPQGVA